MYDLEKVIDMLTKYDRAIQKAIKPIVQTYL